MRSGNLNSIGSGASAVVEKAAKAKANSSEESHKKHSEARLKGYVDRLLKLKEEASNINADLKSVYDEAADAGYDRKALKYIVKLKRQESSQEFKQNVNQYCLDLGMPSEFKHVN